MTDFENTKTIIEAYMDDFVGMLDRTLAENEHGEKLLPDFKRAIACNVSEWAQPEQICSQKASMETILNTAILAAEKFADSKVLLDAGYLVSMENDKCEIIEGYDDLMKISFARQDKIKSPIDGVNFDGESFSL